MENNILIFGKNGQLGFELNRALSILGKTTALGRESAQNVDNLCGDLENPDGIIQTLNLIRPSIIVNAAAYTAVDLAETHSEKAHLINAIAVEKIAQWVAQNGAFFVHYSTDYVFDGAGDNPWRPDDVCQPINIYGQSKRAGELAIIHSGANYAIIRTSWVCAARGKNFVRTMLKLALEKSQLQIVADQFGAPTCADMLADVSAVLIQKYCLKAQNQPKPRANQKPFWAEVYHCAPRGVTNWRDLAVFCISQAKIAAPHLRWKIDNPERDILPIMSTDWKSPAARPKNSRLNIEKIQTDLNLTLPTWQLGITRIVEQCCSGGLGG